LRLARKDQALAETAALWVLTKKCRRVSREAGAAHVPLVGHAKR
jgi:hypothetical protein